MERICAVISWVSYFIPHFFVLPLLFLLLSQCRCFFLSLPRTNSRIITGGHTRQFLLRAARCKQRDPPTNALSYDGLVWCLCLRRVECSVSFFRIHIFLYFFLIAIVSFSSSSSRISSLLVHITYGISHTDVLKYRPCASLCFHVLCCCCCTIRSGWKPDPRFLCHIADWLILVHTFSSNGSTKQASRMKRQLGGGRVPVYFLTSTLFMWSAPTHLSESSCSPQICACWFFFSLFFLFSPTHRQKTSPKVS